MKLRMKFGDDYSLDVEGDDSFVKMAATGFIAMYRGALWDMGIRTPKQVAVQALRELSEKREKGLGP